MSPDEPADMTIGTDEHTDLDEPHHGDALSDALWTFQATPDPNSHYERGVVDGDTYHLLLDQGFRTHRAESVRAWHIDTEEIFSPNGPEAFEIAQDQRQFVIDWMDDAVYRHDGDWPLLVRTGQSTGAYGRWLAMVFDHEGNSLEADLVDEYGEEYLYEDASPEDLEHRFDELSERL